MRFLIIIMALCAAIFLPRSVLAQSAEPLISSAYLYEVCKRDSEGNEVIPNGNVTCQSYIAGVLDYHNMLQSMGTSPNVDICVPAGMKLKDLQEIVWHYLDKNTQNDAFVAAPSVTLALHKIFPCQKARKRK